MKDLPPLSRPTIALVLLALATFSSPAAAATLEVDPAGGTPYTTIQSAIDAAVAGQDDVLVRCGTYAENVVMRDQISVVGENPACAIVDGSLSGSVVTMIDVGQGTVLQGLTLRNGRADLGGGIYVETSAPTITGNVIRDNSTTVFGLGGGIFVSGVFLSPSEGAAQPVITHNVIVGNTADEIGGGISIYYDEGTLVADNLIAGNSARQGGGGIDVTLGQPRILNNTVVDNCSQSGQPVCNLGGGGVRIADSTLVELINNVVVGNEVAVGAIGGGVGVGNSTVVFRSNDTWSNSPQNYAGIADPTGTDGNISLDPLFFDHSWHSGGYEPRSHSPLVEAAFVAASSATDLLGVARPQDGDADGNPSADIGARENQGLTGLRFESDGVTLTWDPIGALGASYNLYRGDIQVLRDTGDYIQDPTTILAARQWCGRPSASAVDLDRPDVEQVVFYLATASNVVEGSLGFSGLTERPFTTDRCP